MKRITPLIVSMTMFAFACGSRQDSPPPPAAPEAPAPPPSTEDEIIMRLSPELVANPQTAAERDRNAIVNYALDKLLDVQPATSGLFYQIINPGQGDLLAWGDPVRVHYKGYFLDGQVFDSSYSRNKPIEFRVGEMIDGWNEALQLLRPGAKALLLVPAHLAYGEEGLQDSKGNFLVPPGKPLVFEVEVL